MYEEAVIETLTSKEVARCELIDIVNYLCKRYDFFSLDIQAEHYTRILSKEHIEKMEAHEKESKRKHKYVFLSSEELEDNYQIELIDSLIEVNVDHGLQTIYKNMQCFPFTMKMNRSLFIDKLESDFEIKKALIAIDLFDLDGSSFVFDLYTPAGRYPFKSLGLLLDVYYE